MANPADALGGYNVDIPDQVINDVMSKLNDINTIMLPYYQTMSEEEKKHLPKIADETIPFAEKADGFLDTEPKYNPQFIDIQETHKDFKNFQKVHPVLEKIQGMEKNFTNITISAGSDAMIQFLAYYNSVKRAAKIGVPGAKAIYDELRKRFPGGPGRPPVIPVP